MKKYEIVKEHSDFDNVIKNGEIKKNNIYIIYNKDNGLNYPRFGIAVGKKIGHAYLRNKIKRQVRIIINNNKFVFKKGKDYIIIVKQNVLSCNFNNMEKKLITLVELGD